MSVYAGPMIRRLTVCCLLFVAWTLTACGSDGSEATDGGSAARVDVVVAAEATAGDTAPQDAADTARVVDVRDAERPPDAAPAADVAAELTPDTTADAPEVGPDAAPEETATADLPAPDLPAPDVPAPDLPAPDAGNTPARASAVVLAGDSWSTGLVFPTRAAMDARGFQDVTLRYETTVHAGSQVSGWVANDYPPGALGDPSQARMRDALEAALDADPPADILVLVISGNDFNRACVDGWGKLPGFMQAWGLDAIQADIEALLDAVQAGRPDLRVVLLGYDYLHYEFLVAFGLKLDGLDTRSYNEGLVELGRRQREVAEQRANVVYAHNYGLLQHVYGDTIHPPFGIPNPFAGLPEYPPGLAPKPGPYPTYLPFPGGLIAYPAPLDQMPDGIHPSAEGFRTLIDHTLDQVLEGWLADGN